MSDQPARSIASVTRESPCAVRALLQAVGDLAPATARGTEGRRRHRRHGLVPLSARALDVYDYELAAAVRAFQQRRGLIVDGVVGPSTYIVLDGARWALGGRLLPHIPGHLLQGDDVAELQERLLALGFSPDRVDGVFGPSTEQAVRRFQCGVGLAVDGGVGPETLRAFADLNRAVSGDLHTPCANESSSDAPATAWPDAEWCSIRATAARTPERSPTAWPSQRSRSTSPAGSKAGSAPSAQPSVHPIRNDLPRRLSRAMMANQAAADIMLSLHCDTTDHPQANGVADLLLRPGALRGLVSRRPAPRRADPA